MATGYEKIYNGMLPKLAECNIVEQAKRLGFTPVGEDSAEAVFLGRTYLITPAGADVIDGGPPALINNRTLLIHYILAEGGIEPKNCFIPIERMIGTIDGQGDEEESYMASVLLKETEGRYDLFAAAAAEMGGTYIGRMLGGECWDFMVLPKMPMRLIYFESDEEFPAELQIQFDETAPYYMNFECSTFLSGGALRELCAIVQRQTGKEENAYDLPN